jgi:hypothetical protein
MAEAKRKSGRPKKGGVHHPFFEFQANKFTRLARDYHHELTHVTIDLRKINRRLHESAALCQQQINFIKKPDAEHLLAPTQPICFEDTIYHLQNFSFRVTAYRDKMMQFVNQALRLGFDETAMGVHPAISNNRIVKDAHIDTELKKFQKDKDFKNALSERILLSHRRYYHREGGYNELLIPKSETNDKKEKLKLWKKNIESQSARANRIVLKAVDLNDKIMTKINDYLKKHPTS